MGRRRRTAGTASSLGSVPLLWPAWCGRSLAGARTYSRFHALDLVVLHITHIHMRLPCRFGHLAVLPRRRRAPRLTTRPVKGNTEPWAGARGSAAAGRRGPRPSELTRDPRTRSAIDRWQQLGPPPLPSRPADPIPRRPAAKLVCPGAASGCSPGGLRNVTPRKGQTHPLPARTTPLLSVSFSEMLLSQWLVKRMVSIYPTSTECRRALRVARNQDFSFKPGVFVVPHLATHCKVQRYIFFWHFDSLYFFSEGSEPPESQTRGVRLSLNRHA